MYFTFSLPFLSSSMKRGISYFLTIFTVFLYQTGSVASVVVPATNCYVLDNSSHIYDFSNLLGHPFEYDGAGTDYEIRFCKDVETRSQGGYVGFGRFDDINYFVAGSGHYDFVQEFYNGDLRQCETSHDKRGRTAQLNIICGDCPNGRCKGGVECVCNVTLEACRMVVDLAIPCQKPGSRVYEGFTVGFHPRTWEIVYNGMTQYGYEKANKDFRFETDQSHVSLYMTAIASLSHLVQKPSFSVSPKEGLDVKLSGSGATSGSRPTTLSPTLLNIDWRCETARDSPYEVQLTIPVEGYDSIQFTLTKMCESKQNEAGKSTKGWALFGIFACVFFVASMLVCCGGFVYKTQVQKQRGIDALPGMTILSACLETLSGIGGGPSYVRPDDLNDGYASQASWTREDAASPGSSRSERTYGT